MTARVLAIPFIEPRKKSPYTIFSFFFIAIAIKDNYIDICNCVCIIKHDLSLFKTVRGRERECVCERERNTHTHTLPMLILP